MLFFLTVCNCCCFFQLGGLQGGHSPHVSGLGLHHHERKQSHVDGGTRYVGWRITDKHNLFLTSPFWSLLSLTLSCSLSWPNLDYVLTYLNLYFRKNSVSVHQQYERPRRIDQSHPEATRVGGLWRFDFTDRSKSIADPFKFLSPIYKSNITFMCPIISQMLIHSNVVPSVMSQSSIIARALWSLFLTLSLPLSLSLSLIFSLTLPLPCPC